MGVNRLVLCRNNATTTEGLVDNSAAVAAYHAQLRANAAGSLSANPLGSHGGAHAAAANPNASASGSSISSIPTNPPIPITSTTQLCAKGLHCKFVHADIIGCKKISVHVSYAMREPSESKYQRAVSQVIETLLVGEDSGGDGVGSDDVASPLSQRGGIGGGGSRSNRPPPNEKDIAKDAITGEEVPMVLSPATLRKFKALSSAEREDLIARMKVFVTAPNNRPPATEMLVGTILATKGSQQLLPIVVRFIERWAARGGSMTEEVGVGVGTNGSFGVTAGDGSSANVSSQHSEDGHRSHSAGGISAGGSSAVNTWFGSGVVLNSTNNVINPNGINTTTQCLSHCAHYYFNRLCNRGNKCHFIHSVYLDPLASSEMQQRAPAPHSIGTLPELEERKRKQMMQQQQQTAAAAAAGPTVTVGGMTVGGTCSANNVAAALHSQLHSANASISNLPTVTVGGVPQRPASGNNSFAGLAGIGPTVTVGVRSGQNSGINTPRAGVSSVSVGGVPSTVGIAGLGGVTISGNSLTTNAAPSSAAPLNAFTLEQLSNANAAAALGGLGTFGGMGGFGGSSAAAGGGGGFQIGPNGLPIAVGGGGGINMASLLSGASVAPSSAAGASDPHHSAANLLFLNHQLQQLQLQQQQLQLAAAAAMLQQQQQTAMSSGAVNRVSSSSFSAGGGGDNAHFGSFDELRALQQGVGISDNSAEAAAHAAAMLLGGGEAKAVGKDPTLASNASSGGVTATLSGRTTANSSMQRPSSATHVNNAGCVEVTKSKHVLSPSAAPFVFGGASTAASRQPTPPPIAVGAGSSSAAPSPDAADAKSAAAHTSPPADDAQALLSALLQTGAVVAKGHEVSAVPAAGAEGARQVWLADSNGIPVPCWIGGAPTQQQQAAAQQQQANMLFLHQLQQMQQLQQQMMLGGAAAAGGGGGGAAAMSGVNPFMLQQQQQQQAAAAAAANVPSPSTGTPNHHYTTNNTPHAGGNNNGSTSEVQSPIGPYTTQLSGYVASNSSFDNTMPSPFGGFAASSNNTLQPPQQQLQSAIGTGGGCGVFAVPSSLSLGSGFGGYAAAAPPTDYSALGVGVGSGLGAALGLGVGPANPFGAAAMMYSPYGISQQQQQQQLGGFGLGLRGGVVGGGVGGGDWHAERQASSVVLGVIGSGTAGTSSSRDGSNLTTTASSGSNDEREGYVGHRGGGGGRSDDVVIGRARQGEAGEGGEGARRTASSSSSPSPSDTSDNKRVKAEAANNKGKSSLTSAKASSNRRHADPSASDGNDKGTGVNPFLRRGQGGSPASAHFSSPPSSAASPNGGRHQKSENDNPNTKKNSVVNVGKERHGNTRGSGSTVSSSPPPHQQRGGAGAKSGVNPSAKPFTPTPTSPIVILTATGANAAHNNIKSGGGATSHSTKRGDKAGLSGSSTKLDVNGDEMLISPTSPLYQGRRAGGGGGVANTTSEGRAFASSPHRMQQKNGTNSSKNHSGSSFDIPSLNSPHIAYAQQQTPPTPTHDEDASGGKAAGGGYRATGGGGGGNHNSRNGGGRGGNNKHINNNSSSSPYERSREKPAFVNDLLATLASPHQQSPSD